MEQQNIKESGIKIPVVFDDIKEISDKIER